MATQDDTKLCHQHLGAQGELIASAWLIGLGYEVFRNVSPTGPSDIVVWHPALGETHLIDVKTQRIRRLNATGHKAVGTIRAYHPDVHILLVDCGAVAGFFMQPKNSLPYRYWPLGVPRPSLPEGYNEEEETSLKAPQYVEWRGEHWTIPEIAREVGIELNTLRQRLKSLPLDLAVSLPLNARKLRAAKVAELANDAG